MSDDFEFEVGHEVASIASRMVADFGLANGAESIAVAQAIANLMPAFFLSHIIDFYQRRESAGRGGGEVGAHNAFENIASLVAASAYMLSDLAIKHTLLAKELKELCDQGAGAIELLQINNELVSLNGTEVDDARLEAAAFMRKERTNNSYKH